MCPFFFAKIMDTFRVDLPEFVHIGRWLCTDRARPSPRSAQTAPDRCSTDRGCRSLGDGYGSQVLWHEIMAGIQKTIGLLLRAIVRSSPDTRRWAVATVNARMAVMER